MGVLGWLTVAVACFAATADEIQTARQLGELGLKAQLAGESIDAERYYQRALAVADPNSLDAAHIYEYRGLLFEGEKRMAEAEHDFLSALTIEEKTPGAEGDQADTLQLYSGLMRETDRIAQAEIPAELSARLRREHLSSLTDRAPVPRRERPLRSGPGLRPWVDGAYPPEPIERPEPEYSNLARLTKLQGTVLLYVEIGTDGKPYNIRVIKPLGLGLDENAVEALRTWRFEPGGRGGRAVAVGATVEAKFRLQ